MLRAFANVCAGDWDDQNPSCACPADSTVRARLDRFGRNYRCFVRTGNSSAIIVPLNIFSAISTTLSGCGWLSETIP